MPIGSVFGAKTSPPQNWEVIAQSLCKNAEHFQSSPDLEHVSIKHKELIDLIKLSLGIGKCPHLLVLETRDYASIGAFTSGKRGPNKNSMLVDENLRKYLRPIIVWSTDALHMLLRKPKTKFRKCLLPFEKH